MIFQDIFKKKSARPDPSEKPNHWVKCKNCQSIMYYKEVAAQNYVCPKCNLHMRIDVESRIKLLSDEDSFLEEDKELKPIDMLNFKDKKSYSQRLEESKAKTGKNSCVISGICTIEGIKTSLVVFDFSYMGGSLGSVEGEKIIRAINRSLEQKLPLVIVSASGGARMQESVFSLMQMAKTSAGLKRLSDNGVPYISVLTDPTFGGVSASFAMLGDIIIAEPGAMVGFAGARVIKQTIGSDLPQGFQSAEFLFEHGLIDMIVQRKDLKATLAKILGVLGNQAL